MSESKFSDAFSIVRQLAADFQANEQSYLAARYSEAQARLDFIDKFWMALGWDVNHEREKNPYEQEVKVERGVAVSNRTKKADYAFFAAPNFRDVKFYVEAKKPARNLDNADDYFQTIRYGWSSNTPLAVLTDFEQFRIVDCRYKPNIATAENFALKKFGYREYADEAKFREIYHLFSRDSVLGGSLEDYAKNLPKRGRGAKQGKLFVAAIQKSVDESFLDDLDNYRSELARAFKNKNPDLDGEDLTEAVTRTLDRLVFIRFLEDKLIEPDTMIDKFASWADFVRTSARLNSFYNGVVFKRHFIDEPNFNADERVFTDICGELSPQSSPYNFNYIPVHILGSIYERFLGKIIVATDRRAAVQEKPEVRKAGGVYYTPEYIVRYIVENTIGKLVADKTPDAVKEMRFADIACGSGSFLLGVYDYLLRWHTDYYNSAGKKGEARTAGGVENADGSFTLSIAQRREILRNNVFGVDVDAQATEVAQLSLALKLLEEATTATTRVFQPKLGEKLLPDMTGNIVCGNSLVDWDILDGQLFERREERKLNPMSYEDKFPDVMRRGGFDAIVGNPPYVFGGNYGIADAEKEYFKQRYVSGSGKVNLFTLLMERAILLLKDKGLMSYIIPNTFLRVTSYGSTREFVLKETAVKRIVDVGNNVFEGATTSAIILILEKQKEAFSNQIKIQVGLESGESSIEQKVFFKESFIFSLHTNAAELNIFDNLKKITFNLGKICKQLIFGVVITKNKDEVVTNILLQGYKPFLEGKDMSRYVIRPTEKYLRYEAKLLHRPRTPEVFEAPEKLLIQRITGGKRPLNVAYDNQQFYNKESINNLILNDETDYSIKYILGLLNSAFMNWFYLKQFTNESTLTVNLSKEYLSQLPIRAINFADQTERAAHDKMVALVEQMLDAKKHLQTARTDRDKTFYQDRSNAIDRQIDKLVYELYALNDDEIKIVEGKI